MKKKPVCIRIIRIFYKTQIQILKKIFKILKKSIKPLFIICLIVVSFVLLTMFSNYLEEKIPFWLVVIVYLGIIINYYLAKQNYKSWQSLAANSEFEKRFCEAWRPHIIDFLIVFFVSLKFCDAFGFIVLNCLCYMVEIWDRRYLTTTIKQDLILEKLNKN